MGADLGESLRSRRVSEPARRPLLNPQMRLNRISGCLNAIALSAHDYQQSIPAPIF